MDTKALLAFSLISIGITLPAAAEPLRTRSGQSVQVALSGHRERGVGLRPGSHGWSLTLADSAAGVAEVHDVTAGAGNAKWLVSVVDASLRFDPARFVAGHAYRVELKRGTLSLGSALVYLFPPPRGRATSHVTFRTDEEPAGEGDEGLTPLPKSAL
jgi:hypothetical protein